MKQITLTQTDAEVLHRISNQPGKEFLEQKFGKEAFNRKIEGRIHSFEDACQYNGVDPDDVLPYDKPTDPDQISINGYAKLVQIFRAFNEGKVPDWKNSSQYKYRPWFYLNGSSGSGLSFNVCGCDGSDTAVASRLHLLNRDHVKIVAERFQAIWEEYMIEK